MSEIRKVVDSIDTKNIQKGNIEKTLGIYLVEEMGKSYEKKLTKSDTV